jgi:DNA processing protein
VSACDSCLRRAALLGALAGWIARVLDERRPIAALLTLGDDELVSAVCGPGRAPIDAKIEAFDARKARAATADAGLRAVCPHGGRYPPLLREAADQPAALFMRGREETLAAMIEGPAVAIVGSRHASSYGLEVAHGLARELSACGVPVVSGMAFGIDSAAHDGALAARGPTVAVMPGGADAAYPRSKHALHRRIAERGLVVSELPPGTRPFRWCFPARNRIMAALARMTVVVEGTERSGSLITARFAQDLGREVGAVPGHVTAEVAAGPNALLADGACVVRSAQDVLDALHGPGVLTLAAERRTPLEPQLEHLLAAVERGETIESLAAGGTGVGAVLAGLTELELLGLVRRGPGGSYVRCA